MYDNIFSPGPNFLAVNFLLGSLWEFWGEERGGLVKKGRNKWKEWRAMGGKGFGGFSIGGGVWRVLGGLGNFSKPNICRYNTFKIKNRLIININLSFSTKTLKKFERFLYFSLQNPPFPSPPNPQTEPKSSDSSHSLQLTCMYCNCFHHLSLILQELSPHLFRHHRYHLYLHFVITSTSPFIYYCHCYHSSLTPQPASLLLITSYRQYFHRQIWSMDIYSWSDNNIVSRLGLNI